MVLQDAVKESFASVGIDFEARNHGMREKQSAPEIGWCAKAIYGTEFDSMVWDFQADKEPWQRAFYAHRIALASQNRPALIHQGILGKGHAVETLRILKRLEEMGMPVLISDPKLENQQIALIPDSLHMSDEQVVQKLPPNLQFFRCGRGVEKNHGKKGGKNTGSGSCTKMQWDDTQCK